jgi:hypothetical protein
MKSVKCSKSEYTSITCLKNKHIPYNLIFAKQFNDSSILITIILFHGTICICRWRINMMATCQCQPGLSSITNVAVGESANQTAMITSN